MTCCAKPDIKDLSRRSYDCANGFGEWVENRVCLRCKTHWHRGVVYTREEWDRLMEQTA